MSVKDTHYTIPAGFTLNQTLQGHEKEIQQLIWSPDGQMLASVASDGIIMIWKTKEWELYRSLNKPNESLHNHRACKRIR